MVTDITFYKTDPQIKFQLTLTAIDDVNRNHTANIYHKYNKNLEVLLSMMLKNSL